MAIRCRDFERVFNELIDSGLPIAGSAAGGGDPRMDADRR